MLRQALVVLGCVAFWGLANAAQVDTDPFGTGENLFTIKFVTISANPGVTRSTNTSGDSIVTFTAGEGEGDYTDPGYNYRMGVYEITNDQWNNFAASVGLPVTGEPSSGDLPRTVTWYDAAQFVNWLNTSTGRHAAYNFTGTLGEGTFSAWDPEEAAGGTNLYRHKDAFYYLPTEDEWVKAAYWNGASIQTWATPDDSEPVAGDDSNYGDPLGEPWPVGSGSEELNGTFDMMGNWWEWMETPDFDTSYGTDSLRGLRGGSYDNWLGGLASSYRGDVPPTYGEGFRVASVPEPAVLSLLALGATAILGRRQR